MKNRYSISDGYALYGYEQADILPTPNEEPFRYDTIPSHYIVDRDRDRLLQHTTRGQRLAKGMPKGFSPAYAQVLPETYLLPTAT